MRVASPTAVGERATIVALLGPTNTGKTHRAVQRMLEHRSGMIGLPLRLLAREIYDRITPEVGERSVALVTGEEKRIPARPRYWVCTVESMPLDRDVDFLAVDEVQLAAHPQRGHVFTDRLLNARGRLETWFMGADTMRSAMAELVPTAELERHPRLSKLSTAGPFGLGAIPPRSALIAFSATEVYQLAERLRRRRGGAAVVLGALSPRARNAQVAMYQAGEVDFLVATDAVGMGLNMDVGHVAFAALRKFDGFRTRMLTPAELAQIAGRAGRYTRDGTFGALSPISIPADMSFAVENHHFAPVRRVRWRNSDLDMSTTEALLESLSARPSRGLLAMQERASDESVLRLLVARPEIAQLACSPERVALLWDVCRIPDFRKLLVEHHASLLSEIYVQLTGPTARLDADFMDERIGRLESDQGDIDALMMRMEFIRTWSYIAHHVAWVPDASAWQERTARAEDRLSEALHCALMERFVAGGTGGGKRSGARARPHARRGGKRVEPTSVAAPSGPFAGLMALRNQLSPVSEPATVDDWVEEMVAASDAQLVFDPKGLLWFTSDDGERTNVARLARGSDLLHPDVKLMLDQPVGAGGEKRIVRRLRARLRDYVGEALEPLRDPRLDGVSPTMRGLMYQLEQGLGAVDVRDARGQLAQLPGDERRLLDDIGVVVGRRFLYAADLLDEPAVARRVVLGNAHRSKPLSLKRPGAACMHMARRHDTLALVGYAALGRYAVRIDVAERVADWLAEQPRGPFGLAPELSEWLEVDASAAEEVVTALGYPQTAEGFVRPSRSRRGRRRR
jgi:ATP-dependent RNA helicase SUPV3L1/SUV3